MAMMNLSAFLFLLEMHELAFASRRSVSFILSLSPVLAFTPKPFLRMVGEYIWRRGGAVSTIYFIATTTQPACFSPGVFASSFPSQSSYPDNQLAKENRGLLVINTAWITPSH